MASHAPNPPAPADEAAPKVARYRQPTVWKFGKPARWFVDNQEVTTSVVTMRPLETSDLAIFDRHYGKPVELVQHLVAELCDVPVEYVQELPLRDFLLLAEEAQWLAQMALPRMGLNPDDYFKLRKP